MISRRRVVLAAAAAPFLFQGHPLKATVKADEQTLSKKKVLFDTDIGSDIDDAVALAYLLRQERCELLGITTVTGDAKGRANLAAAMCRIANKDVPIYIGIESPLVIPSKQKHAPQAAKLEPSERHYPSGQATAFMRRTIRENPHQITLLAVGPLTNVAVLFKTDPEIPKLLKELVIMGGKYSDYPTPWGPTEWNAINDPHAAHIVFSSQVPNLTAFGLDVTWQLGMTPADVAARFKGDPLLELVLDWSEVWFKERELLHFHDPLAAAALFHPNICGYKQGTISVDLSQTERQGVTTFTPYPASPFKVASSVTPEHFFNSYFNVFNNRL